MGTKKIKAAFFVGLVVLAATVFFVVRGRTKSSADDNVLRIYTWSNYFTDELLQEFTKRTGIKVLASYFSSNEELLAKLKAGAEGYDVIQPSDYMVRQMARLGMLMKLDHAALPNLANLDDAYRTVAYDPGQIFSVPFTWGTTGIAINTGMVTVPADGVSWKFLLDSPDGKHTSLLDDMREVFAVALRLRGFSVNSTDASQLKLAQADISAAKPKILMFNSEPKALLLKGEIAIAQIFSCDAVQASRENPKIRYFLPHEGATLWTDNVAVPLSSRHGKQAHAFVNFLLDPEVALKVVREKALATVNRATRERLSPEERNDPQIYPPKGELDRAQFLEDIGDSLPVVNRLWTELKT